MPQAFGSTIREQAEGGAGRGQFLPAPGKIPLALVAFVVSSVVWVVYRIIERAQDSNQAVVHTQELLTAIETVLSTLVDMETAARRDLASASAPEPLDPPYGSRNGCGSRPRSPGSERWRP